MIEMRVMGIALDTRSGSPIVVLKTTEKLYLFGLVQLKQVLSSEKLKTYK